jgi:plasmid stabilization system protein ParE
VKVVWLPEAEQELMLAADWYEARAPQLGLRLLAEVLALVDHLTFAPRAHARLRGALGRAGARRALVEHFPWSLIYSESEGELVVVALIHTRRGRAFLRRRLRPASSK